jgi:uncharacterized protein (TIGR00730 family)
MSPCHAGSTPELADYVCRVTERQPIIAVFGASRTVVGDGDYEAAERCGRLLAEAGCAIVTGGYGGSMEAASKGAATAGGRVVGVTAPDVFPGRARANEHVGKEIIATTVPDRIHIMLDMAEASISLEGSIGTLTELMVAWNVAYVAHLSSTPPRPVVVVGERWASVVAFLSGELSTDPAMVTLVADVDTAVAAVTNALGLSLP